MEVHIMKIIKTCSTKMTEDHDAVQTELTLDFTGLTPEDILEIAAQAAVIKWQGNVRRSKLTAVPTVAEYRVQKAGSRIQVDPAEALVRKFGSVEAAVAALQGMLKH
jgi:DNA integrity scanning protein DisA with diadenylate cyclase activity